MDKHGQSVGFAWIIGLIFLLLLGIGYVVYNQVLTVHIEPVSDSLIESSPYLNASQISDIQGENDKYMAFWYSMPFIMVFIIVIYVLVSGFRKGEAYG